MMRLVATGVFARHPGIKIITHHLGGMIPYHATRVANTMTRLAVQAAREGKESDGTHMRRPPGVQLKMFYGDTCTFGSLGALVCGMEFFGADHILFASDSPFDPEKGPGYIRETMRLIDEDWNISATDRRKIYQDNAVRLLKLDVS